MNKGTPIFDLEKIPDSELIKHLRFEIGILNSEIEELKYKLNVKIHPQSENSAYIISLEGQVKNLKAKVDRLTDEDTECGKLRAKISSLEGLLAVSNRQISILQKELFKYAKNEDNFKVSRLL